MWNAVQKAGYIILREERRGRWVSLFPPIPRNNRNEHRITGTRDSDGSLIESSGELFSVRGGARKKRRSETTKDSDAEEKANAASATTTTPVTTTKKKGGRRRK